MHLNDISSAVIGCAMRVHSNVASPKPLCSVRLGILSCKTNEGR
jgi:hypothetical protein